MLCRSARQSTFQTLASSLAILGPTVLPSARVTKARPWPPASPSRAAPGQQAGNQQACPVWGVLGCRGEVADLLTRVFRCFPQRVQACGDRFCGYTQYNNSSSPMPFRARCAYILPTTPSIPTYPTLLLQESPGIRDSLGFRLRMTGLNH